METNYYDIEIEQAIIGACIIEKTAFGRAVKVIKNEDFYEEKNLKLFQIFEDLNKSNTPIDFITISQKFKDQLYLAQITSKVSSSANIEYWCAIIKEKATLRGIIDACQYGLNHVENSDDAFSLQSRIIAKLEKNAILKNREPIELNELATATIRKIEAIQKSDKHITGIDTLLRDFNEVTNGLHAPDLNIIAARPGTGKTALALNLAVNAAIQGIPVAFFTLEMSGIQLTYRIISILSDVFGVHLKKADLNEMNWKRILDQNYNLPIYIDDTPGITLTEFKEKSRTLYKEKKIGLCILDYLQLMNAGIKGSNREGEISTISRGAKHMAKELNIPIIALAQLSRDVEKRGGDGAPRLSDLRESGAIEQDADNVIFLYDTQQDFSNPIVPLKVDWAKHRNGAVMGIELNFDKRTQKFSNI